VKIFTQNIEPCLILRIFILLICFVGTIFSEYPMYYTSIYIQTHDTGTRFTCPNQPLLKALIG